MEKVVLQKSHAIIGLYIIILILCISVVELISATNADFRSREYYIITLYYLLPVAIILAIGYEIYMKMSRGQQLVIDHVGVQDEIGNAGTFDWAGIDKIHFQSNFGIYQVHIYAKGRGQPVRLGPVKISKEQMKYLRQNINVSVVWY